MNYNKIAAKIGYSSILSSIISALIPFAIVLCGLSCLDDDPEKAKQCNAGPCMLISSVGISVVGLVLLICIWFSLWKFKHLAKIK